VCDACQKAKSHQLPYPTSTSRSSVPLEQVFSDVWGPAPLSAGKHGYYVSFIDDFSKFTCIYFLKKRSNVHQAFLQFQQYVERKFNRKIITMQTDWGSTKNSIPFSNKLASLIMSHVLMLINKMASLKKNIAT
jgi:hypothetical protein